MVCAFSGLGEETAIALVGSGRDSVRSPVTLGVASWASGWLTDGVAWACTRVSITAVGWGGFVGSRAIRQV
jgi:hypothetical protein